MQISELSKYGVAQSLIDLWRDSGHDRLLPIQRIAVQRYNLFGGENILVSAPTSSGKTFVSEMAIGHTVQRSGKAIYLVPLKALASEKFETFRERYSKDGARVVISTRDCREYDDAIEKGKFEIAIVVYEKMQQILTRKSRALQGVKLIVADEIQMLADRERGADLEILLTRLRLERADAQFIGLSAVLRNNEQLSRWLGAKFLEYYERPVELRRGILYQGKFDYRTYNAQSQGDETLPGDAEGDPWQIMMSCALGLAKQNEQSLIFLPDKRATREMAVNAAEEFGGAPAVEAIEELRSLEETRSREMLITSLQSGIAFHNADLCIEERRVVEKYFRQGSVKIICATPTLAVGVNLPVKNVFIDPQLWDDPDNKNQPYKRAMTKGEYDNMGGRAGRLSLESDFGRSIMVAGSPLHQTQLTHSYFESELEPLKPALIGTDLATNVMSLVASGAVRNRDEIAEFLSKTYTGVMHEHVLKEKNAEFRERIETAVARCVEYGVLTDSKKGLAATELGRVCTIKGILAESGHEIHEWLSAIGRRPLAETEAIYALCRTAEMRRQHINMSTAEFREGNYPQELLAKLPHEAHAHFGEVLVNRMFQSYEQVKPMKAALLLSAWVNGHAAKDIEEDYHILAGTIRAAGETCGWLADATASIADLLGFPNDDVKFLRELSVRLEKGVSATALPLCKIRVSGFGRAHIQKLSDAGLVDLENVRNASEEKLAQVIGKALASQVREYVLAKKKASEPEAAADVNEGATKEQIASETPAPQLFHCADRIHFDGSASTRRTVMMINGKQHLVPNKVFAMMLRMAIRLLEDGTGWVRSREFGEHPNQAVSNARAEIQHRLLDSKAKLFESDGYGSYRLSVPSNNVSFDWDKIREHWDGQIKSLARARGRALMAG